MPMIQPKSFGSNDWKLTSDLMRAVSGLMHSFPNCCGAQIIYTWDQSMDGQMHDYIQYMLYGAKKEVFYAAPPEGYGVGGGYKRCIEKMKEWGAHKICDFPSVHGGYPIELWGFKSTNAPQEEVKPVEVVEKPKRTKKTLSEEKGQ